MENKITVTSEEYKELVQMATAAAIIKRMVVSNKYVSTTDIKAVFDIKETEGGSNETV